MIHVLTLSEVDEFKVYSTATDVHGIPVMDLDNVNLPDTEATSAGFSGVQVTSSNQPAPTPWMVPPHDSLTVPTSSVGE